MTEMGVYVYTGIVSTVIISPPLMITMKEIDRAIDEALKVADEGAALTEAGSYP